MDKNKLYIGPCINHNTAFSKKTLFVPGNQPVDTILVAAKSNSVSHIELSKDNISSDLKSKIETLLSDFYVTLVYSAEQHLSVVEALGSTFSSRRFIPMLVVDIPDVNIVNENITLMIDDSTKKSSNYGAWFITVAGMTDSNKYSSWEDSQYIPVDTVFERSTADTSGNVVESSVLTVVEETAPVDHSTVDHSTVDHTEDTKVESVEVKADTEVVVEVKSTPTSAVTDTDTDSQTGARKTKKVKQ